MATVIDSYTSGIDGVDAVYGLNYRAQIFTASASYTLNSVILKMYKLGDEVQTLTVRIYGVDTSTPVKPDITNLLATGTMDADTITLNAAGEEYTIVLVTPIAIVSGTQYAIIVDCRDSTGGVHYAYWKKDTAGATYAGGTAGSCGDGETGTYIMVPATDYYFKTTTSSGGAASTPVDKTYSKELIAIGNNEVWREAVAGTMSVVNDASDDIDTTDVLNAVVAFQKLFIVNGTNLKVLDFVNTKLTTGDINPAAADGPPDFGSIITGGTSGASMIVDYITVIDGACTIYGKRTTAATFVDTETVTGINASTSPYYGTAGAISFDLTADEDAPPHWYDWTVYGVDATNYGIIPTTAYQVCRYRGRLQLCGDPNYPHQWYQSRQLNPFDFLYAAGDAQSPVAGNNTDCGEVGDIVKVAIPYSDDYLVYGCANELWVMSGDAAFGGELNPLDTTTGILGDRAWCWDDKGNLYIVGTAGLLRIPKGFGAIENLTRELWPDFVEDLVFDSSLHRITLAFDPENFGIHIFKTTLATGACMGWWYDLRVEGLFPDAIPTTMGIYSAFYYQTEDPSYRKLLVGCADGYIKSFDKATVNDDGTLINSYVGFAPLALSIHPRKDGIIKNFDIVTGIGDTDSSNVTCTVHVARTAGQIIKKLNDGDAATFTKVFVAPNWTKSNLDRRSIRGQWGAIVLTNSVLAESWSMERLIVDSKEIGRSL